MKIQHGGSRHLENHKNCDGLTDADAKWVSHPLQSLKYLNFTNPRWRTAAILKTVKSPYLLNSLTDFDEIWHDDAHWPPTADRPLKFRILENPRWRRPPS